MLRGEQLLVTKFEASCLKREEAPKYLNEKCSLMGFVLLMIMLLTGAITAVHTDNWTFFEGFYAYFITFTTVGFGDLIPGGGPTKSPANTAIRIIFIIIGLAAMSNVINGLLNCKECVESIKRLKARFGRKQSVDKPETKDNSGMELNV